MSKSPTTQRVHTSMRGVNINMTALREKNENSVAVTGNGSTVRMNARGDTLKAGGRVDRKREQIEQDYNTQLHGNAKKVDVRAVEADVFETPQQVLERLAVPKTPAAPKPVAETPTDVDPAKNVVSKDRARKLIEKDD